MILLRVAWFSVTDRVNVGQTWLRCNFRQMRLGRFTRATDLNCFGQCETGFVQQFFPRVVILYTQHNKVTNNGIKTISIVTRISQCFHVHQPSIERFARCLTALHELESFKHFTLSRGKMGIKLCQHCIKVLCVSCSSPRKSFVNFQTFCSK